MAAARSQPSGPQDSIEASQRKEVYEQCRSTNTDARNAATKPRSLSARGSHRRRRAQTAGAERCRSSSRRSTPAQPETRPPVLGHRVLPVVPDSDLIARAVSPHFSQTRNAGALRASGREESAGPLGIDSAPGIRTTDGTPRWRRKARLIPQFGNGTSCRSTPAPPRRTRVSGRNRACRFSGCQA